MSRVSEGKERIPEGQLAALRRRLPLVDTIARHVNLRKAGRDWVGLCPFHKERSPSFNVVPRPDGGFYHCFGCGAHGDIFTFTMRVEGLGFREAVAALALDAGIELPESLRDIKPPKRNRPAAPLTPVETRLETGQERAEYEARQMKRAEAIADGSKPLPGTWGEVYLRQVRGIDIDWPSTILFNPKVEYWHTPEDAPKGTKPTLIGSYPAVVAIRETVDGDFGGVWVIYLAEGGLGKAQIPVPNPVVKRGIGSCPGSAVRLGPPAKHLGIAEGIEDAGAAIMLSGGVIPMWAALSTSGMRNLELPPEVTHPIVFCNNDRWKRPKRHDGTILPGWVRPGWDAAQKACERWRHEGRHPSIELPLIKDFNEALYRRIGRHEEAA